MASIDPSVSYRSVIKSSTFSRRAFVCGGVLFSTSLLFLGCEQRNQKRPYGYIRLGKLSELLDGKELSDKWLLVRRDAEGIYVLSTLCAHDLEPLTVSPNQTLVCPLCASEYSMDGEIKKGPTEFPLPYYELKLDQGEIGGPQDTLYAYVGVEKSRDYRLQVR